MDILKDIEKNILNINIYDKNVNNAKLNIINKQISDYFKSKDEENNIIMEKKIKYEEKYKKPRELNNSNYEQFLEKKQYLHNIYKETKSLSDLYEYLNCKIVDYADIPEIYTYEYLDVNEQKKRIATQSNKDKNNIPNANTKVCPEGQILNPETKRCVDKKGAIGKKILKNLLDNKPKVKPDEPKVKPEEPKVKECPEGQILNPETKRCVDKKGAIGKKILKNLLDNKPKVKPDEPKVKPEEPKVKPDEPKVKPEEPKVKPEEPKVKPDEPKLKECPEGQIRNPETKRCVDKKGAIGKKILKNLLDDKHKK